MEWPSVANALTIHRADRTLKVHAKVILTETEDGWCDGKHPARLDRSADHPDSL